MLSATHPPVAGVAANAEALAQLGYGVHLALVSRNELQAFSHRGGLFPRHGVPPDAPSISTPGMRRARLVARRLHALVRPVNAS